MNELSANADLKEINEFKKKISWGEVPTVYQLTQNAISELDGLQNHGFDNAFKRVLEKNNWNLDLLQGKQTAHQEITVSIKPQLLLKHVYSEQNYELHCFPVIDGEKAIWPLVHHPQCPFIEWQPESMSKLCKVSNLVAFIQYAFNNGDQADIALIRYAHQKITQLIGVLSESFDIVGVKGYNIAQFCQEINHRKHTQNSPDINDNTNKDAE